MGRRHEDWLRDVTERQRNVMFPDTAFNEGRFWRNLFEGKQRLNAVQIIGVAIFAISVVALAVSLTLGDYPATSWRHNVLSGLVRWVVAFAILFLFLLIFRLSQLSKRKRPSTTRIKSERK